MNQRSVYEHALKMRQEIKEAAEKGSEYAQKLHQAYERCDPVVLTMPWPEPAQLRK